MKRKTRMSHTRIQAILACLVLSILSSGCTTVNMKLFTDTRDPLLEQKIQGSTRERIAVIPVTGIISDIPEWSMLRNKGSMVQEVVSQLNLAADDDDVKAIVLKVNSPGGTVTGSDILYKEIETFKRKTGKKVVVSIMDLGTSGGYYISLPADSIIAHPTSITGSVGVIFLRPKFYLLMNKIGVGIKTSKSGTNKDMGSPFRQGTPEEERLFQSLTDQLAHRFINLVAKHREMTKSDLQEVSSARIFLAEDALKLKLIDRIGYLDAAIDQARELAGMPDDPTVIVYRRSHYPDDNIYNTANSQFSKGKSALVDLGLLNAITHIQPGFYFIWTPGIE